MIDDPSLGTDAMLEFVKGPDFPTAALIFGGSGIKEAYRTGRGSITIRGKAEIEAWKGDRERIIVTELPYQVNKAKLIEKIADLVRDKRIEGISDLRDESDRVGMRMVIEIKKGENSSVILNRLYKLTQLQDNFGINLLAIHQGQPKTFNLRDMLWAFIEHRKDVVVRRTLFDLKKAEARAHILEGLKRAVENIDEVIQLIKAAKGPDEARMGLMSQVSVLRDPGAGDPRDALAAAYGPRARQDHRGVQAGIGDDRGAQENPGQRVARFQDHQARAPGDPGKNTATTGAPRSSSEDRPSLRSRISSPTKRRSFRSPTPATSSAPIRPSSAPSTAAARACAG